MKNWNMALALGLALSLPVCGLRAEEGHGDQAETTEHHDRGTKESVALKDVPKIVLDAAQGSVKGVVLTEAKRMTTDKGVVYKFDGKVGDKKYEIFISADGKVLKAGEDKEEADGDKGEHQDGADKGDDDKKDANEKEGADDKDGDAQHEANEKDDGNEKEGADDKDGDHGNEAQEKTKSDSKSGSQTF